MFYPLRKNTVPVWAILTFATTVPILVILFIELVNAKIFCCQDKGRDCKRALAIFVFNGIALFYLGLGINMLLNEIGKKSIGRLRPHFMSVCKPDYSKFNCTSKTLTGFVFNQIGTGGSFCTGDPDAILEARLSM